MITRATIRGLVAILCLGGLAGACDDDPPPPAKKDAAMEARLPDGGAADARDASSTDARVPDAGSDGPGSDAPAVDAPASDAPVVDAPVTDAPAVDGPSADAPVIDAPAADAPVVDAPAVDGASDDAGSTQGTDGGLACAPGVSREMICSNYCQGVATFCTGANTQFPSVQACLAACNAPTWACGTLGQTTGNTLFCRIAHLALAIAGDPAVQCPNAGPNSATCR